MCLRALEVLVVRNCNCPFNAENTVVFYNDNDGSYGVDFIPYPVVIAIQIYMQ
jgi:hypothetical protein